jgi:transposase, IS5 family
MYLIQHNGQLSIEEFFHPFGGHLDPDNRWVVMSEIIPWEKLEDQYAPLFNRTIGAPAKPFRMALGALCIQQRLGLTDRDTVEIITECPYMQYFIGLSAYQYTKPFDSSMMVHFRKRIGPDLIKVCNDMTKQNGIAMVKDLLSQCSEKECTETEREELASIVATLGEKPSSVDPDANWGTLILDATCAPEDIPYPSDLRLLNEARETTEYVIDNLHAQISDSFGRKPRCNRDKARSIFLSVAKKKKTTKNELREAKRFQLSEISRNLSSIDKLIDCGASLSGLEHYLYKKLLVTSELYRQQQHMYDEDACRVDNRIVNLSKPHVRPIVRGKAGRKTEFGAKISVSDDNGFVELDRLGWENYNESADLIPRVEKYKQDRGYYPERVCADLIYMTSKNKQFCADHGIRLSGRRLGRNSKAQEQTTEQKELFKADQRKRSVIEGRFGTGKRKYGLDLIMTKLVETSECVISMALYVMNIEKILRLVRLVYAFFLCLYYFLLLALKQLHEEDWILAA